MIIRLEAKRKNVPVASEGKRMHKCKTQKRGKVRRGKKSPPNARRMDQKCVPEDVPLRYRNNGASHAKCR